MNINVELRVEQYQEIINEIMFRLGTALGLSDGVEPFDAEAEDIILEVEERLFRLADLEK